MSVDLSYFQNPKMAIIRLLKSQCLCSNPNNQQPSEDKSSNQQNLALLKYKQQLQLKVARQRSKLNEIPCVITLTEQIEQVKQIIGGLTKENRERIKYLQSVEQTLQRDKVSYVQHTYEQEADLIEHQKLQAEYANILRVLEITNDENQRLVKKLASM